MFFGRSGHRNGPGVRCSMLNPRLALLPDYPFERLRGLLDPLKPAAGLAPIVMTLGEPQHPQPEIVARTIADSAHLFGRYPPIAGTPEFREAVRDWLVRRYGVDAGLLDRDTTILPLSGTKEGLFLAALVAVPPEKAGTRPAVLMPNPFYQCYAGAAVAAGADPVYVPATRQNGFLPDFAGLGEALLAGTALVYLCTPSNPQGTVADLDYLAGLLELARRFDFVLAVDECYAEIYGGEPPPGALQAAARLGGGLDRLLVFHSLSKRSSVPGLRAGFVAGDPALIGPFRRLRDYGGASVPLPILHAATALWRDEAHVEENRRLYRRKFDLAERTLSNRFGFYRPAGGFFLWLDVGDGERAARRLWTEAALRVLPGEYLTYGGSEAGDAGRPYVRVALVQDEATTAEALQRLGDTLQD